MQRRVTDKGGGILTPLGEEVAHLRPATALASPAAATGWNPSLKWGDQRGRTRVCPRPRSDTLRRHSRRAGPPRSPGPGSPAAGVRGRDCPGAGSSGPLQRRRGGARAGPDPRRWARRRSPLFTGGRRGCRAGRARSGPCPAGACARPGPLSATTATRPGRPGGGGRASVTSRSAAAGAGGAGGGSPRASRRRSGARRERGAGGGGGGGAGARPLAGAAGGRGAGALGHAGSPDEARTRGLGVREARRGPAAEAAIGGALARRRPPPDSRQRVAVPEGRGRGGQWQGAPSPSSGRAAGGGVGDPGRWPSRLPPGKFRPRPTQ